MSTRTRFEKEAKGNSEIVYWLNTNTRFEAEATSQTHGWRKTKQKKNKSAKWALNCNQTPVLANEAKKKYRRFLHQGKP